ncbi:MAG TPA: hypothetical protein VJZ27_07385, partial [Aggregatilineales bacterium]|nr:hypothetical protein [Aggregatilineales bacterium]
MHWKWPGIFFLLLSLLIIGIGRAVLQSDRVTLSGHVLTDQGAANRAVVRVQADHTFTITDAQGYFALETASFGKPLIVTAWLPGYINSGAEVTQAGHQDILITLEPHISIDNAGYAWFSENGIEGSAACALCHTQNFFEEWRADAHAQSAVNPRFLSVYRGTSLSGQQGFPTTYT